MAMKKIEGFECLETADLAGGAYGAFSNVQPVGSMTATIEETGGSNGGKCLRVLPGAATYDELAYSIQGKAIGTGVSSGNTVIVGFHVKFNTLHEAVNNLSFFAIQSDAGTADTKYNLILALNTTYNIVPCYSSGGGTFVSYGAASSTVVVPGVWYYIEVKFTSHNSTGSIYVAINGTTEITLTGKDTLLNDSGVASAVFGATLPLTTVPSVDFDNIYIADTTGTLNNDFIGPVQVVRLDPNGNGNSSQFVGDDADSTNNYLHVDDSGAPDDDTSYVESYTTGNKDTYSFENLPSYVSSVHAVAVKVIGKKNDPSASDLKVVSRSSGTEADSANIGLDDNYQLRYGIFETDPNTSAAWAASAVDAAEFGIKVA